MRTLRLALAGTVILTLLGGLGGAALAQMDEDADAVYATWASDGELTVDVGSESFSEDLYRSRDGVYVGPVEWSDPRVSGLWNTTAYHPSLSG